MSFLAHEAQRGRITQIMNLIDTKIRPGIQQAITESSPGPVWAPSSSLDPVGHMSLVNATAPEVTQLRCLRIVGDEPPKLATSGQIIENPAISVSSKQDIVPKLCTLTGTMGDPVTTSFNRSSLQGLSRKPDNGTSPNSCRALNANEHKYTVCSFGLAGTTGSLHSDQDLLGRLANCLRYLRSDNTLPKGLFEGATADDLSVLDDIYGHLSRMVQAIDRKIAALVRRASEGFDRHMASSAVTSASTRRPRRFRGQEDWQVDGRKKTLWNANADWGSEMAWSEVEVKQAEPSKKEASSKLRYPYIPCEWNLPASELPS